jgi:hypothetical protein
VYIKKPGPGALCTGPGLRYKTLMGRVRTGAGHAGRARGAVAVGLLALCAACQPGDAGPGAKSDSLRFAHTLVAAPGPRVTGPGGGVALPGGEPGRVWARVVSPEATDRLAAHYCVGLAPFGPAPWRVPTADELAGAPLDRFSFLPGDLLWTTDRPDDAHHRRVVVDPLTGALGSRAPAQALHLRVLCVADTP